MKDLGDFKLTILPMAILIILAIVWKLTDSVGAGMMLILFWMSWRQLIRKMNIN
ncbi:hypothetical protein JIN86_01400 [Lysinibacillus sp. HST-98]|uniref:Uncharacterized protein n=1 Tax=Lysinibacillus capsici TaxID=2115968 RepID=A0ABY8KL16_9BACI|nr:MULTISPECIES: hypothetical protein [Lysinibacillus]EFI67659.1 hypothetical protein BFZC1_15910 [Lysinibacillus fusiformis ZC1]EKU44722.1 hypothetical protein C518_0328 [Lysinibacillus fusiformis ZB2]WHP42389.1 hypothetical protein QIX46_05040 [Lysinibacillus boronitolerans]MBL3728258.1 hypothetical protein [Lysinibacillus sp. HST-98]MBU5252686.1 hypothetical protein [Lysinibacillus capsici]